MRTRSFTQGLKDLADRDRGKLKEAMASGNRRWLSASLTWWIATALRRDEEAADAGLSSLPAERRLLYEKNNQYYEPARADLQQMEDADAAWLAKRLRWWITTALTAQDHLWAVIAELRPTELQLSVNLGGMAEIAPNGRTFIELATLSTPRLRYREWLTLMGDDIEMSIN